MKVIRIILIRATRPGYIFIYKCPLEVLGGFDGLSNW